MKILFLCTANIQRSRTAEDLFREEMPQHVYRSAGLSEKECKRNHTTLCTEEMLVWADKVYVFEQMHLERIQAHTDDKYIDKIHCLDIEDVYQYMQPELIILLNRLRSHLR